MNPWFIFVLGLLVGWLIEWLIDYFYWRFRCAKENASQNEATDDLKVIKGIGPIIERKLNDLGIYTFAQLGKLTAANLREFLGDSIENLADEESILQQARDLAKRK